jgi:ribA/ribD-fused uncharacterized protein
MRVTDTHIYFWGSFLSNFIPNDLKILYCNHIFTNSEQIFMFLKAVYFNDMDMAANIIVAGKDPRTAKKLGGQVKNFKEEEWAKVREEKMYTAIMIKFQSDNKLKQQLLDTGDKILVEGTPFDPIWGVMIKWDDDRILDEKNWKGQNLLGKVLMRVRNDIK